MKSFIEKKKKEKGFTLIELLAVIVILAILALIAIPIVISIIRDSRSSSNKRSVDSFGRAAAGAMSNYMTKNDIGDYSSLIDNINSWDDFIKMFNIKYSGSKVKCDRVCISPSGGIGLVGCYVGGNNEKKGSAVTNDNGTPYIYTSGEPTDTGTYMDSYGNINTQYFDSDIQDWVDTEYYGVVGTYYVDYGTDTVGTTALTAQGFRCTGNLN